MKTNIRRHYHRGLEELRKHADENDVNSPYVIYCHRTQARDAETFGLYRFAQELPRIVCRFDRW
jgi:hypothetical protein